MRCYIVIPAHNEEAHLATTLNSLANQSLRPSRVLVVNDNSTDFTQEIITDFAKRFDFISGTKISSGQDHTPGTKVVEAFYKGFSLLDEDYDIICKFDADLEFPSDYMEKIVAEFKKRPKIGIAGGFCTIKKESGWVREELTGKDHIRGALKAYRKECFEQIGGIKKAMGWDTIDELLAQFHGWKVQTIEELDVKHLKPTGTAYASKAGKLQGTAFRRMHYGFILTSIASAKLAFRKGNMGYFFDCMKGYLMGDSDYLVTPEEGKFIRKFRWKKIWKKLF